MPYWGEERFIKRFAIFPVKVDHEIVWLETVYLRQKWRPDITIRGWYNDRDGLSELLPRWQAVYLPFLQALFLFGNGSPVQRLYTRTGKRKVL